MRHREADVDELRDSLLYQVRSTLSRLTTCAQEPAVQTTAAASPGTPKDGATMENQRYLGSSGQRGQRLLLVGYSSKVCCFGGCISGTPVFGPKGPKTGYQKRVGLSYTGQGCPIG